MTAVAEPTIIGAVVVAGHDGQAELAVDIRYPNGAVRQTVFPVDALAPVLDAAGVDDLDGLVGAHWSVLLAGRDPAPSPVSPPAHRPPSPAPSPSHLEAPACST